LQGKKPLAVLYQKQKEYWIRTISGLLEQRRRKIFDG
jgi:hypothetical protein